jgi:RNA polymerase sigma-70 factor, ECF subfamily
MPLRRGSASRFGPTGQESEAGPAVLDRDRVTASQRSDPQPALDPASLTQDSELLASIAAGSQRAMATLFDRYQSVVFAVSMSALRDRDAAMDVLGEVMLAVWRQAGTFQGRSTARTWILGIAIHKIRDQQRRNARFVVVDGDAEDREDPAAPECEPRMVSEREALQTCLGRLSAAQREVLHLAFHEDMSSVEIGEALAVPAGTVRSRLHYATRVLRRCLEKRGITS